MTHEELSWWPHVQARMEASDTLPCDNCGGLIQDRSVPRISGPDHPLWVHTSDGSTLCHPQMDNSPRATPAKERNDT